MFSNVTSSECIIVFFKGWVILMLMKTQSRLYKKYIPCDHKKWIVKLATAQ